MNHRCYKCENNNTSSHHGVEEYNNGDRAVGKPYKIIIHYATCNECYREFYPTILIKRNDENNSILKRMARKVNTVKHEGTGKELKEINRIMMVNDIIANMNEPELFELHLNELKNKYLTGNVE